MTRDANDAAFSKKRPRTDERESELAVTLQAALLAVERVTSIAKASTSNAATQYEADGMTECDTSINDTLTLAMDSVQAMSRKVTEYQDICKGAPIKSLPNELLTHIFSYLDLKEAGSCLLTCRHWYTLLLGSPHLYANSAFIDGNDKKVISGLKGYRFLTRQSIQSLTLYHRDFEESELYPGGDWNQPSLYVDRRAEEIEVLFPSSSLQYFKYEGEVTNLDGQAWYWVTTCTNLKSLRWYSRDEKCYHGVEVDLAIEDTPLAGCKLEEFCIDVPYKFMWDTSFVNMLNQLKYLCLNVDSETPDLGALLFAAKDTLIKVRLLSDTKRCSRPGHLLIETSPVESHSLIEMPNLETFAVECDWRNEDSLLPARFRFSAPQVTTLAFCGMPSVDWLLIDSCRNTLEDLQIVTLGGVLVGRLATELFDFPELRFLLLGCFPKHRHGSQGGFSHFYNAIDSQMAESNANVKIVLPNLECLTIFGDYELRPETIVNIVKSRIQFDLRPLCHVSFDYMKEEELNVDIINYLKQNVDFLRIRTPHHKEPQEREWTKGELTSCLECDIAENIKALSRSEEHYQPSACIPKCIIHCLSYRASYPQELLRILFIDQS